jgi:peptidoglycan hydrolase-like protein with peptidoglycan-binding domain
MRVFYTLIFGLLFFSYTNAQLVKETDSKYRQTQKIQAFLKALGFAEVGKADGVFGKKTEQALRSFQEQYNINTTGKIDDKTVDLINSIQDNRVANVQKEKNENEIEGNKDDILGIGKASTFGHKIDGSDDSHIDDGNTFCNTKSENKWYTYKSDRPKSENLKVCVAALKIKDIKRIFKISSTVNRKAWCGKKIEVTNLENNKKVVVTLMDQMNDNVDKIIDLSGCAMKEIYTGKDREPSLKKVQVTWAKEYVTQNTQVAELKK